MLDSAGHHFNSDTFLLQISIAKMLGLKKPLASEYLVLGAKTPVPVSSLILDSSKTIYEVLDSTLHSLFVLPKSNILTMEYCGRLTRCFQSVADCALSIDHSPSNPSYTITEPP